MLQLEYKPYTLKFKFKAGTSRGSMTSRKVWFVRIWDTAKRTTQGLGEAAPLPQLSIDNLEQFETKLAEIAVQIQKDTLPDSIEDVFRMAKKHCSGFPSIQMALEMALIDLINGGHQIWFESDFTGAKRFIPINGLIWMGEKHEMENRILEKLRQGFSCIKLKIGAIDFEQELRLVKLLRSHSDQLIIRLDANGAFNKNEALQKIERLSEFDIQSLEQPILPQQPDAMHLLCRSSQIPIALDEELIGLTTRQNKEELLDQIKPHFLVLKPSLLGGFNETQTWIDLANKHNIGWWVTSALESSLGLDAISQFTGQFNPLHYHQGLGTGHLFENNLRAHSVLHGTQLKYDSSIRSSSPF